MILVLLFVLFCATVYFAYKVAEEVIIFSVVLAVVLILGCICIPTIRSIDESFVEEYNNKINIINTTSYPVCYPEIFSTIYIDVVKIEEDIRTAQKNNKSIWFGVFHSNEINNVKLNGSKLLLNKCIRQKVEKE